MQLGLGLGVGMRVIDRLRLGLGLLVVGIRALVVRVMILGASSVDRTHYNSEGDTSGEKK